MLYINIYYIYDDDDDDDIYTFIKLYLHISYIQLLSHLSGKKIPQKSFYIL